MNNRRLSEAWERFPSRSPADKVDLVKLRAHGALIGLSRTAFSNGRERLAIAKLLLGVSQKLTGRGSPVSQPFEWTSPDQDEILEPSDLQPVLLGHFKAACLTWSDLLSIGNDRIWSEPS